jgi:hypothetical protein
MMARKKPESSKSLEILDEKAITFVGQPERLRGNLFVHNPGPTPFEMRTLPLVAKDRGKAVLMSSKPGVAPNVRLRPAVIRPGHSGPVALRLDLDPHTPPGEYQAEVQIADKMQPVVVHVTERVALRIRPSELVIENQPEQKISKRIIATNLGNVPLTIGEIGAIFLDDDLLYCRTLRAASAAVGDELRPLNEYLAQILLSAKEVAASSGILRVQNKTGTIILQPGETVPIDLEIRVPPGLDRRGRFRGVAAINTADVTFIIVPTSGPQVPKGNESPKRRSRKTSAANQNQQE